MKTFKIFAYALVLFSLPALLMAGNYGNKAKTSMDIVDTAVSAGNFSTLVAALKAAELVDVLRGEGPFTVFAPTDDACAKLPAGTYHVVPGNYMAADVVGMSSAKTVNGESFGIRKSDGKVMVDTATVVKTDIMTSNGVIHVVDKVLIPEL